MNNYVYEEIKELCPISTAVKARNDGEYLIIVNDEFEFQFLNIVASDIYCMCDGTNTIESIIEKMYRVYDVNKDELIGDICNLMRDLQWKKLIKLRKYVRSVNCLDINNQS